MFKAFWINGASAEFQTAAAIRSRVFSGTSAAPAFGVDELDAISAHALVCAEDGVLCATGRVHPAPDGWRIGRIAVLPEYRKIGYGDLVVRMLLLRAVETYDEADITVHALPEALGFYQRYGFTFEQNITENGVELMALKLNGKDVKLSCGGS